MEQSILNDKQLIEKLKTDVKVLDEINRRLTDELKESKDKRSKLATVTVDIKDFELFKELLKLLKDVQHLYPECSGYVDTRMDRINEEY